LGNSNIQPEAAIIIHMRTGYNEPERFSSFGMAKAPQQESTSHNSGGPRRKA
jgi:hypothetical protein